MENEFFAPQTAHTFPLLTFSSFLGPSVTIRVRRSYVKHIFPTSGAIFRPTTIYNQQDQTAIFFTALECAR